MNIKCCVSDSGRTSYLNLFPLYYKNIINLEGCILVFLGVYRRVYFSIFEGCIEG